MNALQPDILIDAILAKKNTGTSMESAPLVIALGPGFSAGKDAHYVVETARGHQLGRLISSGYTLPNTGIPGDIAGHTGLRVLRAPTKGVFLSELSIGAHVEEGQLIGLVSNKPVNARLNGVLRGLIRPGTSVTPHLKIGDIDPRGEASYCVTISEKARAIAGTVLEAILRTYNSTLGLSGRADLTRARYFQSVRDQSLWVVVAHIRWILPLFIWAKNDLGTNEYQQFINLFRLCFITE